MKSVYLLLSWSWIVLFISCSANQSVAKGEGASLTTYTFDQLDSLMAVAERPAAVFLHADWCKFCRNMEQTTFQNKAIIRLLNEAFYFISFDGEQREKVSFNQHEFAYQPNGRNSGTHQLAFALGAIDGTLAYPTLVILNSQYEIVFQHGAFLGARQLQLILTRASEKVAAQQKAAGE